MCSARVCTSWDFAGLGGGGEEDEVGLAAKHLVLPPALFLVRVRCCAIGTRGSLQRFRKDLTIHCPSRLERWRRRWRRGRLGKRYVVRLSAEERRGLEAIIHKGKSSAARLLKARILLKADVSEAGEGWSDSRIVEALETSVSMVYRVRRQLVEEGLEAILSRKAPARPSVPRIFDGEKEARLIATACSQPPEGTRAGPYIFWRARWSSLALSRPPATQRSSACSKKRAQAAPPQILGHSAQGQRHFRAAMEGVCRSTPGPAIPTDRWFVWMRPPSSSSPKPAFRSQ